MSETNVAHTKPLSRMQSLSESRGGSKVTKPIFRNTAKRYISISYRYITGSPSKIASHAGLFRGACVSSLPTNAVCGEGRNTSSPKKACVGGYKLESFVIVAQPS